MHRIEPLTGKAAKDFVKLTEEFTHQPQKMQGICSDCGKGIPLGYLYFVSKWKPVTLNGIVRQQADEIQCHECGLLRKEPGMHRKPPRRTAQEPVTAVEEVEEALTPKEIALRLLKATSSEPHGSKWLATTAGLEYGDYVLVILRKLRDAGRIRLEDGKWLRA